MRPGFPKVDVSLFVKHFEAAAGVERMRELSPTFADATAETIESILDAASQFAEAHLSALNDVADAEDCRIVEGRVKTAPGHKAAWDAFVAGGWCSLDHPPAIGGQGLPLALAICAQEIFDRSCPAFGMLPVPQRSAVKLIAAYGDSAMQAEWLPHLVSGEWGATICISEVEAGSDAGRMRTRAEPNEDGTWSITGEKCWITYGDHDLSPRIGHCLLARTPNAPPGGAGLSLFLVADQIEDNGIRRRNSIRVRRVEHKMGLHASPTCALGFEGARGHLIGVEGRGLAQMFVMITNMRLSTGVEGLSIAGGAVDLALDYAQSRRQGGKDKLATVIAEHPDVQRQLLGMLAQVETTRGLALTLANQADIAAVEPDAERQADAAALVQWLLPIFKTTGSEVGFDVASVAMQVLGGAGFTREWPIEQGIRDARVLTIVEGTTGIQALDLVHRRLLRGDKRGLAVFKRLSRQAIERCHPGDVHGYTSCLDLFDATAARLQTMIDSQRDVDAGATAFLHLAALAATAWIAARLSGLHGEDAASRRLAAAGRYWLSDIAERSALLAAQSVAGSKSLDLFANVRPGST